MNSPALGRTHLVMLISSVQGIEILQVLDQRGLVQMPWEVHATNLLEKQWTGETSVGLQRASSANFCWEVVCERWLVEIPVEMSQMSSKKCLLWFCGLVEGCSIPMIGSYHLETFRNHFETELWLALDSLRAIYWLQLSIAQLQGVHHCRSPIGIIDINLKISQEPRFKEFSQLQRGKVPEGLPGTVTSSWQEPIQALEARYHGFGQLFFIQLVILWHLNCIYIYIYIYIFK